MEIYNSLETKASKEFKELLNGQLSKSKNIGSNMDFFKKFYEKSSIGVQGLNELEFIFKYFSKIF